MDDPYEGAFGSEIREQLFSLDGEAAFTNHGSYGTVPRPVFDAQVDMLRTAEAHPDSWFRRSRKSLYLIACESVAEFIGAPKEEVVLLENATTAVNVVLRSLKLDRKDGVLATTLAYNACRIAVEMACKESGATCHLMNIRLPITKRESIVKMYRY